MNKNDLLKTLHTKGFEPSHLDDITHDAANQLASSANNGGLEDQVNFLIEVCGWSAEDILNELENA